jgi:superfamily II DNA or RNA helicase
MELRDYQMRVVEETRQRLRKRKRVLIQLPTGGGKTAIAAHITKSAVARGYSTMFLCHRDFLVDQTSKTFAPSGIDHSFVAAGRWYNQWANSHIGMVQTVRGRLAKLATPRLVVWDEAHHIGAATWAAIMAAWPDAIHIGLSATPVRLDGKGLDKHFDDLVIGPSVKMLIERGHLSDYRAYAPSTPDLTGLATRMGDYKADEIEAVMDKSVLIGDMVQHYRQHAAGKLGVYFCTSIKHSQHVAAAFREAGISAQHLDGTSTTFERGQAAQAFANRDIMILTNVDLFGEGYDLAAQAQRDVTIEMVGLGRPTQSLGMFMQQVGRALRPEPGKMAIILDHAGNISRHGLPDDDRDWKLTGLKKKPASDASTVRQCEYCFSSISKFERKCRYCGGVKEAAAGAGGREVEQKDGELQEIDKDAIRKSRKLEEWQCSSLQELIDLGERRGYKDAVKWAGFMFTARAERKNKKAYAEQQALNFYETMMR